MLHTENFDSCDFPRSGHKFFTCTIAIFIAVNYYSSIVIQKLKISMTKTPSPLKKCIQGLQVAITITAIESPRKRVYVCIMI